MKTPTHRTRFWIPIADLQRNSGARRDELGPIDLVLLKRNDAVDVRREVGGLPAAQEVLVDPGIGLHLSC